MTQRISISLDDFVIERLQKKKGGLTVSEYIQECLLTTWERHRISDEDGK